MLSTCSKAAPVHIDDSFMERNGKENQEPVHSSRCRLTGLSQPSFHYRSPYSARAKPTHLRSQASPTDRPISARLERSLANAGRLVSVLRRIFCLRESPSCYSCMYLQLHTDIDAPAKVCVSGLHYLCHSDAPSDLLLHNWKTTGGFYINHCC